MGVMFTNLANYGAPPCGFTYEKKVIFLLKMVIFLLKMVIVLLKLVILLLKLVDLSMTPQVMLMLRRLHSDLSEGGGSPRHGGYAAAPAPVATGEGGGIIDSALTPLSGTWMRILPVERGF